MMRIPEWPNSERACLIGLVLCFLLIVAGSGVFLSSFSGKYYIDSSSQSKAYPMYTGEESDEIVVMNFSELSAEQKDAYLNIKRNSRVQDVGALSEVLSQEEVVAIKYDGERTFVRYTNVGFIDVVWRAWVGGLLSVLGAVGMFLMNARKHEIRLEMLRETPLEYVGEE